MKLMPLCVAAGIAAATVTAPAALAQERTVRIAGIGPKSGVLRSMGLNSEAALLAAVDEVNKAGGIRLADGTRAKLVAEYLDDRCNAEEGISLLRRIVGTDTLVAIGPICSNVAEPMFGILQKKAGDSSDSGLQMPTFSDGALKPELAKISEWAFRNTPSEKTMYDSLFQYVRKTMPELKTVYGGVEEDFAHSRATWYTAMKDRASANGYEVQGETKWLLNDTNFSAQVREIKKVNPDILAIGAHPFTTCGLVRELSRQKVKPKLIVGLTSSASLETLQACGSLVEGLTIPSSYAPVNKDARHAADATAKKNGSADLHSMGTWENVMILKTVMDKAAISGRPDTVQADRKKVRDGLAALTETAGLLGTSKRTPDREAIKPYVFVHVKNGAWAILHNPL